ncbi:MAG: hypothetical protein HRU07_09830 [Nitrosopumilus sp.]|nr:hypothetical protein [Nitrosopumilus sp.]NRA06426.1 hypothetical protein [Nitrosopumilus sp.]
MHQKRPALLFTMALMFGMAVLGIAAFLAILTMFIAVIVPTIPDVMTEVPTLYDYDDLGHRILEVQDLGMTVEEIDFRVNEIKSEIESIQEQMKDTVKNKRFGEYTNLQNQKEILELELSSLDFGLFSQPNQRLELYWFFAWPSIIMLLFFIMFAAATYYWEISFSIFKKGTSTGILKTSIFGIVAILLVPEFWDIYAIHMKQLAMYLLDPFGENVKHADYYGLDVVEIKTGEQFGLDPFNLFKTKIEAADIIGKFTEAPVEIKKEWHSICDDVSSLDELYEKSSPGAKKYLEDLVKGSIAEIFKGDIKFSDRMIISLKHLEDHEYEGLFILLALTYAWKRVNELPANQWKIIFFDEAWRMTKRRNTAYKVGEIARQIRKLSGIFVVATQFFTDLDGSIDDNESKVTELFDTKIVMGMARTAAKNTGNALDLTDDEIERIVNFKPGNGLLQTSTNSIYLKFEGTEDEEKIYFNTKEKKVEN